MGLGLVRGNDLDVAVLLLLPLDVPPLEAEFFELLLGSLQTVFLHELVQLLDFSPTAVVVVKVNVAGGGVHDDGKPPVFQLHRDITGDGVRVELDALLAGYVRKAEGGAGLDQIVEASDGSLDCCYVGNKSPHW